MRFILEVKNLKDEFSELVLLFLELFFFNLITFDDIITLFPVVKRTV